MLTGVIVAVAVFVLAPIFGAMAQAVLARTRWYRSTRRLSAGSSGSHAALDLRGPLPRQSSAHSSGSTSVVRVPSRHLPADQLTE